MKSTYEMSSMWCKQVATKKPNVNEMGFLEDQAASRKVSMSSIARWAKARSIRRRPKTQSGVGKDPQTTGARAPAVTSRVEEETSVREE